VLRGIARSGRSWNVATAAVSVESDVLVITAGLGTNEVLELVPGCSVRFPYAARPAVAVEILHSPPARMRGLFTEAALPVFAYLDIGIYGHPLYDGKTPGVKIGLSTIRPMRRWYPAGSGALKTLWPNACGLRGAEAVDVAEASGVDGCSYDPRSRTMISFSGTVPGADDVFTGVGWRGTGIQVRPVGGSGDRSAGRPAGHCLRHPPLCACQVRPAAMRRAGWRREVPVS